VEVLEAFPIDRWSGPYEADLRQRARRALESGRVVFFPKLAFPLDESERHLLTASGADGKAKNISFDPEIGALQGTALTGPDRARLQAMMERFARSAATLVSDLLPNYAERLERARTSFRPVEIKGRHYSPIKDDRLLHVDAFPSRPTRGRRILRFFANIAEGKPRVWRVGEPFEAFARQFLPRVGAPVAGSAWLLERLGITKDRRSRYDHIMLALHDKGKQDAVYQAKAPREEIAFPPQTCWLVYTDQVLHAALAGQFALEQTFHLDVEAMGEPALSPLRVLERLAGRPLV